MSRETTPAGSKRVSLDRLRAAAAAGGPLAREALAKHDHAMAEIAEIAAERTTPAIEREVPVITPDTSARPLPSVDDLVEAITGTSPRRLNTTDLIEAQHAALRVRALLRGDDQ